MTVDKIEEVFAPATITSVEELVAFVTDEILRRGGDPTTVRMVNTAEAIPNVKFSDEWPCWTIQFARVNAEDQK